MSDQLLPQRWTPPRPGGDPARTIPDPPAFEESESVLKVALEFLALLRRHLLLVGACLVLALGGLAAIFYTTRPVYRAGAVIRLIDKSKAMAGGLGTSGTEQFIGRGPTDPILSQLQVLQSRAIAQEIATRVGLQLHSLTRGFGWKFIDSVAVAPTASTDTIRAHFSASGVSAAMGSAKAQAAYGAPLQFPGVSFVVSSRPPVADAKLVVTSLIAATNQVVSSLKGRPRDRTDVIDVTYEDSDPVRAQRVVNGAVAVFQDANARAARQESVRRREFIEEQLHKTEAMLSEAQAQQSAFQARQHAYSSLDKFKGQQSDLSAIDVRRQELQADRTIFAGLLAAVDSAPPGAVHDERFNALVSSPGLASNPVVAQLFGEWLKLRAARDSLTTGGFAAAPTNPDVRRLDGLIATAQANVLTAVRGQLAASDARLQALDEMKAKTTSELASLPGAEAQEAVLVAQVNTYDHEAEQLRAQLQKAQIDEAAEAGDVQIVDVAQGAGRANGSGRVPKVFFALLLGLVLGGAVSYVLENYSAIIRKRDDLERAVTIPNLAIIPRIQAVADGRVTALRRFANGSKPVAAIGNGHDNSLAKVSDLSQIIILSDARSGAAEAYRTLRTNLLFSSAVRSLRSLVVTSAGPQEGKSTTAANLAVALAQQGHRVVIVECDLRRPRVHKMFDVPQEPGLTNVLLGADSIDSVLHETRVPGLRALACGPIPPNPVELLGSVQMRELLAHLDADMIVLDTPPLLVASDAAVLGRLADGVLLVVRAGQTQRAALQECAQQLANVGARVVGTVLNDPDAEVAKYTSYYQYYYKNYYSYSES